MPGAILGVVALVLATVTVAPAAVAASACPPAQYTVVGAPLGDDTVQSATVEIDARVGLGSLCPMLAARRMETSRHGVVGIRQRWDACAGLHGAVRLKARVVDGCTRVIGTLRAGRYRRHFEADRSDCGDGILDATPPATPYAPTLASLDSHPLPRWFDDAKFGIMVHWGIFTIPAWAELVIDPGEWLCCGKLLDPPDFGRPFFTHIPYVEWYQNTILIPGSPAQAYHAATYGADFPYEAFRPQFETAAQAWSGEAWADLFREAGARYVVLVTKHHDGFALWPTSVPHPTRSGWNLSRDVVGELDSAVRRRCMRMGLYYSGGFDWSVKQGPIQTVFDGVTVAPQTPEYAAYADGQWRELIQRYRPAVLWNDITYPNSANVLALFADYYNAIPDGVVNDRFTILPGLTHHDYSTPEFSVLADISATKFETVRGMGRGFGYNRNETDADLESAAGLIGLLVDVVSKNGNLLLNVGPMADGTVPVEQVTRLRAIGAWLGVNGEAIFGTRPWTRSEGMTADGTPVRFTASRDGGTVYATVLGALPAGSLTLLDVPAPSAALRLLGRPSALSWTAAGADIQITLPTDLPTQTAYVFTLS
jgi:alpha-L-fucosidase